MTPDLLPGKGITGGYPLTATLVHERVFARFADGAARAARSFTAIVFGNPLGAPSASPA